MNLSQKLQKEIEESKLCLCRENEESTYTRDLKRRIELINWVLDSVRNHDNQICNQIESKMQKIILTINQIHSIIESDKLHSELRILIWIFYQVSNNKR
jgi:uncharacterized protein YicC (UPF0701 family)